MAQGSAGTGLARRIFEQHIKFDEDVFFFVLLPPIILEAGPRRPLPPAPCAFAGAVVPNEARVSLQTASRGESGNDNANGIVLALLCSIFFRGGSRLQYEEGALLPQRACHLALCGASTSPHPSPPPPAVCRSLVGTTWRVTPVVMT